MASPLEGGNAGVHNICAFSAAGGSRSTVCAETSEQTLRQVASISSRPLTPCVRRPIMSPPILSNTS